MSERASLYELSKTLKAWERKVEISEVHGLFAKSQWYVCHPWEESIYYISVQLQLAPWTLLKLYLKLQDFVVGCGYKSIYYTSSTNKLFFMMQKESE